MGGFDISLGLGLGLSNQSSCMRIHEYYSNQKEEDDPCNKAYPSLTLGPSSDDANTIITAKTESEDVSSFSNSFSIKRERDQFTSDELEPEIEIQNNNIPSNCNRNPSSTRKKLRLTKEQSEVLEDTFKEHSALHPKQKQELARKLDLETRQVEVWFQNRRARTKLKQTEVECEVLKKCYEKLTEENKKLQKELKELKSMKTTSEEPFYMQLPVASQTVCPSCKRISGGSGGEISNNGSSTPPSLTQCPVIISIRSTNLLRLPS